jgi:uncharacterized protein (TIGR00725 family)
MGKSGQLAPEAEALAFALGREVARAGALLLCGGRSGAMAAAAAGAKSVGGRTIGIHPAAAGEAAANDFVDCAIYTGLGDGRNYVNVHVADAVLALDGGPGTLSEIALALKLRRPLVYVGAWRFLHERPGFAGTAWCAEAVEAVAAACAAIGHRPGEPFGSPLLYPEMPEQSAQARQLREFVAAAARKP